MKIAIQSFQGVAPKIAPRYLPDGAAQVAINVEAFGQSLKPLRGTEAVVGGPNLGGAQTIYKFGQDYTGEEAIWFNWTRFVDVCRSQIAGNDTAEWTFYSGDGYPKATNNGIATQGAGSTLPRAYHRLGLPAPLKPLTLTVGQPEHCEIGGNRADHLTTKATCEAVAYCAINGVKDTTKTTQATCEAAGVCKVNGTVNTSKTTRATCEAVTGGVWYPGDWQTGTWIVGAKASPAKITLTASVLSQVTSAYGVKLSTNNGADFVTAVTAAEGPGYPSVTILPAHLDQMSSTYGLKLSADGGKTWATATLPDTITRNADLTLSAEEISSIKGQTYLDVTVTVGAAVNIARIDAKQCTSPQALVAQLNSSVGNFNSAAPGSLVVASISGSGVYVKSKAQGSDVAMRLAWAGNAYRKADGSNLATAFHDLEAAIEVATINDVAVAHGIRQPNDVSPTSLKVTSETAGANVKLVVKWGASATMELSATGAAGNNTSLVDAINALPITATYLGATAEQVGTSVVVSSVQTGAAATLRIRWGEGTTQLLTATGVTADLGTKETRVYTYTWVMYLPGMTWESAPWTVKSMPTASVYPDGSVLLKGFETVAELTAQGSGGWGLNGNTALGEKLRRRIYRAVNGVYLYVDEIEAGVTEYTDIKDADQLGEELPSLLWTPPPENLTGMINLPNGMMGGFYGRELHFCEPYRPYAWPDTYAQVVDYPVVGLGRMDTTLAVLTTGVPYFIQGSAPDVAVMVKSDIEQACVSKRSIVSMGGAVFYASPDGLMMLSSSGSDIITKDLMDRDAWQALTPSSIIAYGHDSRYVAFHTPTTDKFGNVTSGFVLDLKSKQFVRHNLTATCGFSDLRTDQLYLVVDGQLVKWGEGGYLTGKWRSKLFSQPQMTGFACAQVESAPLYDEDNVAVTAPAYPVTTRIYADQRLFYTWTVSASDYYGSEAAKLLAQRNPFRLPPLTGFLGRDWEIELDVTQEIFNVALAQAMAEIAST